MPVMGHLSGIRPRVAISEVPNEIAGRDHCPVPRWRYSRVGIAVKCVIIPGAIVGNLGTKLDLRREPMLPTQRKVGVVAWYTGALTLRIHEKFGANGDVVQLVPRIVDVGKKGLFVGGACQRSPGLWDGAARRCPGPVSTTHGSIRSVEWHKLWAEGGWPRP
jgi:hypothetical protein